MFKKILLAIVVLLIPVSVLVFMPSQWQLSGEQSSAWQARAAYPVKKLSFELIDTTRKTPANGSYEGDDFRKLKGHVWYPELTENNTASLPLLIYNHGFMSFDKEAEYLTRYLAANGYVVLAASFPLSNTFAPGGASVVDVPNQAGDVSFLIDSAMDEKSFPQFANRIDASRIAVAGLSLGGLTTELAAFHPTLRDERISVAISIAGPTEMFTEKFFQNAPELPFMMIAGDIDAMIPYQQNGLAVLEKSAGATLFTIKGGSHTGFAGPGAQALRFLDNPDLVGCTVVKANIDLDANPFEGVFREEDGVVIDPENMMLPCEVSPLPSAMNPRQQHELNKLAILAFLEMNQSPNPEMRESARTFLFDVLPSENEQIEVK